MDRRYTTVAVWVEVVDHDHGHWCRTCLHATGIRVWVTVSQGDRMHMQTRLYCYECGGVDVIVADDARHC